MSPDSCGRMTEGFTFMAVYLCIPHVIHRGIHHINTPSAKCIYHLSVCGCHGSSCGGSRELGQAVASLVSISCVAAHLYIHSSTHFKAMINRSINAKKNISHALWSEICFNIYNHNVDEIHSKYILDTFSILCAIDYTH